MGPDRTSQHCYCIASLPAGEYGLVTTAVTIQGLRSSLPHIRIGLLVGIGAGIPGEKRCANGTTTTKRDVRLGDVIVSNPDGTNGGVVQYDFRKAKQSFERKGSLNSPPLALRSALAAPQAEHEFKTSRILEFITESLKKYPNAAAYSRPNTEADTDRLFEAAYQHNSGETCESCVDAEQITRTPREHPLVHFVEDCRDTLPYGV
jgi:hypothetical protein